MKSRNNLCKLFLFGALWGILTLPVFAQYHNEFKVMPDDAPSPAYFGESVAMSGAFAVIGADGVDDNGPYSGAAYIFQQNTGGDKWVQVKKLLAFDGFDDDRFGGHVAMDGDYVLLGASLDDDNGNWSGSAYLFARNQGGPDNWGLVKKLLPSDGDADDYFGNVAINGDIAAIGAGGADVNGQYSGAVYLFERNQGGPDNWGEVKKITPSDGAANDWFGNEGLDIDGDTLIVCSASDDTLGSNAGAAYFFYRDQGGPGNWGEVIKITASDGAAGDQFGRSAALDGDLAIVGACYDEDNGDDAGSAYILSRNQGGPDNWGEVKKLLPGDGMEEARFGISVSISGDRAVIGADEHHLPYEECGTAYLFVQDHGGTNNWGEYVQFNRRDPGEDDSFGSGVAVDNGNVLIGSYYDDDANSACGSAYFYNEPAGPHMSPYPPAIAPFAYEGDQSPLQTVTVYSVGTQSVMVSDISGPGGEFSLHDLPGLPVLLAPGESITFEVQYAPLDTGLDDATVDLTSDDVNDPLWAYPSPGTGLTFAAPGVCYASTNYPDSGRILTLDMQTGAATLLGDVNLTHTIRSLAIDSRGRIFTEGKNKTLLCIDSATGEGYTVGTAANFYTLAFDETDTLYGIDYKRLYMVNPNTGALTEIAYMANAIDGMAFDPTDGTLYASASKYASVKEGIYTIDKTTGQQTLVGLTGLGFETTDLVFDLEGNLYGVTNDGTDYFNWVSIDKTTGAGTIIGATGFQGVAGLDLAPVSFRSDLATLSAVSGGVVNLDLNGACENAGRDYLILGSWTGTSPGTPLPGDLVSLPLVWDSFTDFVMARLNTAIFSGFLGTLDSLGTGTAQINVGKPIPTFAGKTLNFAYCIGTPYDFVSIPIAVEILP